MTTPTLELNIKASGVEQVEALKLALAELNSEAAQLKNIGANASALDRMAQEMRDLRTDVVAAVRDLRTALVDGLKGTFQQAEQVMSKGASDLTKAFDEKMKGLSKTIQQEGVNAAKAETEVMEKLAAQSAAGGKKVGENFATALDETAAKIRLSYRTAFAGGASVSLSAGGLGSYGPLLALAKQVEQEAPALAAAYAKEITALEKQVTSIMKAATEPGYLNAGPKWWEKVIADEQAAAAAVEAQYAKSIVLLEKEVASVMRAATQPGYLPAGPKWWDEVIAQEEAAQAKLDAAYAKSITVLDRYVTDVMKAATQPAYLPAGPKWWDEVIAQQEAAQAKLDAAYAKSIAALDRQVASIMKAATQPQYFNAGPAWWDKVIADQEAAQAKLEAEYAKTIVKLEAQTAAIMKAATQPAYLPAGPAWWDQVLASQQKAKAALADGADLKVVTRGLNEARVAAEGVSGALGHIALNQRAVREGGTAVDEVLRGAWLRLYGTLVSLVNALGGFNWIMSGIGVTVGIVAAAIGTVAAAAFMGEREVSNFNKAMVLTNGYVGLTRGGMDTLAQTISQKLNVSIGTSKEALLDMAKTGKITGGALSILTQDVILQSELTGQKLESVVQEYAKMPDGVHKWAEQHNESMHFMSAAQLEHVRLLELQGKKQEAMIEVGNAVNEQFKQQTENLGSLERAARRAMNALSELWNGLKAIGRTQTLEDRLAELQSKLTAIPKDNITSNIGGVKSMASQQQKVREALEIEIAAIQSDLALAAQAAATKADALRIQEEGMAGDKVLLNLGLKIDRLRKEKQVIEELTTAVNRHNAAWLGDPMHSASDKYNELTNTGYIDAAEMAKLKAEVIAKYGPKPTGLGSPTADPDFQLLKSQLQQQLSIYKDEYTNEMYLLDSLHQHKLISEGAYQAESLKYVADYRQKERNAILAAQAAALADYQKDIANVENIAGQKHQSLMSNGVQQQLRTITDRYIAFYSESATRLQLLDADTSKKLQKEVIDLSGKLQEAEKQNTEYWAEAADHTRKAADLAKAQRDLAGATDEQRAVFEADTKVQDSYGAQLRKLQTDLANAQKSVEEFNSKMPMGPLTEQQMAAYVGVMAALDSAIKKLADANAAISTIKAVSEQGALDTLADKKIQTMRDEAKKTADALDKGIVDALFNRGKNAAATLRKQVEDMFLAPIKILLQAVIQPFANGVVNMGYQALGLGNAIGAPGSSLLSLASGASSLSNLYGTGTGMVGNFAAGYTGISGYGAATTATATMGGTVVPTGTALATDATGATVIASAAGATQAGGIMAGITSALSAIPVWGWAALAAIAVASFFGKSHGPKVGGYAGAGTINPSGVGVGQEAGTTQDPAAIATLKTATDTLNAQYSVFAQLLGGKAGVTFGMGVQTDPKGTSPSFAEVTARGADGTALYSNVNTNIGRTDAELQAAITDMGQRAILRALESSGIADKYAAYLKAKDTSTATADDIKNALAAVQAVGALDKAVSAMGPDFAKITNLSMDAGMALITAAGGLDKLSANLSTYYQNFYSDGERQALTWNHLRTEFAALNQTMPTTRMGFRDLVNGIDISTASGTQLYTALLALSGEFASVTTAVTDTANGLKTQAQLTQDVTDAKQKLQDAYNAEKDTLTQLKDKFTALGTTLKDFMKQLTTGDLAGLTPQQQYTATKAQLQQDMLDMNSTDPTVQADALTRLQQDSQDFLTASRAYFGASQGYYDDLALVKQAVQAGTVIAKTQVDKAQEQLDALDQMVSGLLQLTNTTAGGFEAVVAAVNSLRGAQVAAAGGTGVTTDQATQAITALYQTDLGRAPDSGGLAYWLNLFNNGETITQIDAGIKSSPEYLALHPTPLATGMDRVPYDGFAATLHADETVLNASAAAEWRSGNSGTTNALLAQLIARVDSLERTTAEGHAHVAQTTRAAAKETAHTVVAGTMDAHSQSNWHNRTKEKTALK